MLSKCYASFILIPTIKHDLHIQFTQTFKCYKATCGINPDNVSIRDVIYM